jgi:hypothetical protein
MEERDYVLKGRHLNGCTFLQFTSLSKGASLVPCPQGISWLPVKVGKFLYPPGGGLRTPSVCPSTLNVMSSANTQHKKETDFLMHVIASVVL